MKKENKPIEVEWTDLLDRLKHHRQRLHITKDEMKSYIQEKYGRGFFHLTDEEIIQLGMDLKQANDKFDFLF